jgi:hypothetical protein
MGAYSMIRRASKLEQSKPLPPPDNAGKNGNRHWEQSRDQRSAAKGTVRTVHILDVDVGDMSLVDRVEGGGVPKRGRHMRT